MADKQRVQLALELAGVDIRRAVPLCKYDDDQLASMLTEQPHYVAMALANVLLHLADQARAAAVPAGNQAKAPTALDEMRALQEGNWRELLAELDESREALARVEAERDELRSRLRAVSCSTRELTFWMQSEPAIESLPAIWTTARFESDAALAALDQAASEAEVPAMSPQELIERFALCHHDIQLHTCPKCRPVPASEAEVTERAIVVGSKWAHSGHGMIALVEQLTGSSSVHLQWEDSERRAWPDWQFREHFTWVSDPEATESATKGAT